MGKLNRGWGGDGIRGGGCPEEVKKGKIASFQTWE